MHDYWFKRKRYGWGWTPIAGQGWATLLGYLVVVFGSSKLLLGDVPRNTYEPKAGVFMAILVLSTIVLIAVCYIKGPSPRWRWGRKSTDNPDEDI